MIYTPEQIREMLDAATPGPYRLQRNVAWVFAPDGDREVAVHCTPLDEAWTANAGNYRKQQIANAELFAAAPTVVRELLTENARLRGALEPFAHFACDPPCDCHNCVARAALGDGK